MTGVELYIRDTDNFYCYKQRHDGYYIKDFIDEKGQYIFNMTAKQIIHDFHDKFFFKDSEYNYHENNSPLCYGVIIPKSEIKSEKFEEIYSEISDFISKNYRNDNDDDLDYDCGYSDWVVYIDLVNKKIEGVDDEEDDEDEDNDAGYLYGSPYGSHVDSFDSFKKEETTSNGNTAINAFVFSFAIENADDDYDSIIGIIPFLSEPEYEESDRSDMDDKMMDACDELDLESKFGVHDVSSGQTEIVDGQEYEAIFGFDTYEVKQKKIPKLMNIWKKIFDDLGFKTGEIIYK